MSAMQGLILPCVAGRGSVARAQASRVTVSVEKTERNTRNCFACIYIAVPIHIVWGALTDYENLGTFIPGTHFRLQYPHSTTSAKARCKLVTGHRSGRE